MAILSGAAGSPLPIGASICAAMPFHTGKYKPSELTLCTNEKLKNSLFGSNISKLSLEPRECHHFALLFGYGASAINPYMVNEILSHKQKGNRRHAQVAIDNYNKAVAKGVLKIMNKIGISTLHSYQSAQIFGILGINETVSKKYFPYTPSRIEGIGLREIEIEIKNRHL